MTLIVNGTANTSGLWPLLQLTFSEHIPKFPSTDVIKPAQIPEAQPLELVEDCAVHIPHLWELWKTACRPPSSATTKQCMEQRKSMLSRAAIILAAKEAVPAAWVAFSRGIWPEARKAWNGPEHAPVNWMYGPDRIVDQMEWFLSEPSGCGVRLKFGPAALQLARTWSHMKETMVRAKPSTADEVAVLVSRFFPGDLYNTQVALARREHEAMQKQIDIGFKQGSFLWG